MLENKDKQPAYGMLAFHRISGGNPNIFAEKPPLKAKEKTEILSALAVLSNTINSHNIFTLSQFDEAMEKIATEAKGEVEAFIQNKMNSLALVSMKETNALNLKNQNPLLPDDNK